MMPNLIGYLHFLSMFSLYSTNEFSACNNFLRETVFLSGPSNISKREGETAVFCCSVSGFVAESDFLTWAVKPNLYTNVISESYNDLTGVMTSTLTVFNVGLKEQTHQCIFQRIHSDYTMSKCSSRVARLDILHFPRHEDISCGPNLDAWIPEHELVVFRCKVKKGNPNVVVSWKIDDLVTFVQPVDIGNDLLTFQYYVKASQWMHNKTLRCLVGSPAFPDAELFCNIGPLKILKEPSLSISPTNVSFQLDTLDARRELFCKGDGIHDFDNLRWSCEPEGAVLGCGGETSQQIIISLNNSAHFKDITYVTATCYSSLAEFRVEAKLNITVIQTENKNISCSGVKMDVEDLSLMHNFSDVTSVDAFVSCFLQCERLLPDQVKFTWYIDENILKDDFIMTKGFNRSCGSFLYLSYPYIQSKITFLKCEALIEDTNTLMVKKMSLSNVPRPNGTNSQIHANEFETWTFDTTTTDMMELTTPLIMSEFDKMALKGVSVSPSTKNKIYHENTEMFTLLSKMPTRNPPEKERASKENHELDRKMLTLVSAFGASIFILIFMVVLCNVIMYRHIRRASASHHVFYKAECKASDQGNRDPLYEEPMANTANRLPPPIRGVHQTSKEQENKVYRNSSSSELTSTISSNNHSNSSQSLEYEDSNSSSDCSHCFSPHTKASGSCDERRLSVDFRLSYEKEDDMYENVYDNQTVVQMHRVGKPRANPTERNLPSLSTNLMQDQHFHLPSFPPPIDTKSV